MEEEGQVYQQMKRLQNARHAREFMQQLINAIDKNKISEKKARALGYLIKIFLDTYQLADLQEKVENLESIVQKN